MLKGFFRLIGNWPGNEEEKVQFSDEASYGFGQSPVDFREEEVVRSQGGLARLDKGEEMADVVILDGRSLFK
jgi:hypothetical protein